MTTPINRRYLFVLPVVALVVFAVWRESQLPPPVADASPSFSAEVDTPRARKADRAPSGATALDVPRLPRATVLEVAPKASPRDDLVVPTENFEGRRSGRPVATPRRVINNGVL